MCDIFKECKKAFNEKRNKKGSQINNLVEYQFTKNSKIVYKDKNGSCCDENNMGSEVEVTFCSKDKGNKRVMERFYDKLYLSSKITNDLYAIRF